MPECKRCLVNERHPFTPTFSEGICRSCLEDETQGQSLRVLSELIKAGKFKQRRYDCLILLNGTPEDYFVVTTILNMGLYPICVFVNSYMYNEIAWENIHNLIHRFDLELRTFNPNPADYTKLVKYSLRKHYDILTPIKMLRFSYTMQLARSLNVSFIISGENQVQEAVRKYTNQEYVQTTAWSVLEHDVHETSTVYFGPALDLNTKSRLQYDPVVNSNKDVKWLFLSDFLCWDQLAQDAAMTTYGAQGQLQATTFDYFHRAGSSVFYKIHDILRFKKYGSLKVADQLSREIRNGRLSRNDASLAYEHYKSVALSEEYIQPGLEEFFSWLGLNNRAVEWFEKHQLNIDVKQRKNVAFDVNNFVVELYSQVDKSILANVFESSEQYCVYRKGVSI